MAGGGFILIKYNRWLVDHTTRIDFIEERMEAGTYSFVKLIGLIFIMASFYVLINGLPGQS